MILPVITLNRQKPWHKELRIVWEWNPSYRHRKLWWLWQFTPYIIVNKWK